MDRAGTLYDQLGVAADADLVTLHRAYRRLAKRFHPDRHAEGAARMVAVNAAWAVLSDPQRRAAYDRTLVPAGATITRAGDHGTATSAPFAPGAASAPGGGPPGAAGRDRAGPVLTRKEAWFAGLRAQMARVTAEAGRSTALALALRRRGRPRAVYDAQIDAIVTFVADRPQERSQLARLAGAAPLDLGLAAALVGLQAFARRLRGRALTGRWSEAEQTQAEMVDRMWDTLAHGVPYELALALGGNPHLSRRI